MSTTQTVGSFLALKPEPELRTKSSEGLLDSGNFDPEKHLCFEPPPRIHTMLDLKFHEDTGVAPIAVSEPFPLFTEEAVNRMRAEVFKPEVMTNYMYTSNINDCMLRGYADKAAPFTYEVWKHPKVLAIISKIAGVDLVPEMDFEIAHINLATKSEKQKIDELRALNDKKLTEDDEGIAGCPWEDDVPLVGWHTDSYPFVCITMLSDCTNMVGGETALRSGDGSIFRVRGPGMGYAVILQGRYIEHQALRAFGTTERITSVTSFRPRCHRLKDDTVLTTVRPISDLSELYNQFYAYRLEILEKRIREQREILRDTMSAGQKMGTKVMRDFLHEQEAFLAQMNKEIVDDELVTKGSVIDPDLSVEGTRENKRKRND